jgi:peroxin-5
MRALIYLKSWIERHPSYAHLVKEPIGGEGASGEQQGENVLLSYFHLNQEVLDLFVRAVEQNPSDADLHTVLGVLYNIANDYDSAVKHFQKATDLRPEDYALWNKLGATLANSSRSKEAVDMYRHALKLKPNYIRAWINLGIAYANQKKNEDAVKFYLRALSMCPRAEGVWQYLAMALTVMNREDLVELCRYKDVERFRQQGFNF